MSYPRGGNVRGGNMSSGGPGGELSGGEMSRGEMSVHRFNILATHSHLNNRGLRHQLSRNKFLFRGCLKHNLTLQSMGKFAFNNLKKLL